MFKFSVRFHSENFIILMIYKKYIKIATLMLPDHYPVFHVDLDYDFQSSDNTFPKFQKCNHQAKASSPQQLLEKYQNTTVFSTIGQRIDNLDRFVVMIQPQYSLLAIFDGHCDPEPVSYLKSQLIKKIIGHPLLLSNPQNALLQSFEAIESQVIQKFQKGSTALIVLVIKDELIVANLGDSKLLGINQIGKLSDYTNVHNLTNSEQLKRVINSGGIVLKKGNQFRINGELNLSRCFGDRHLKYCLSSVPQIYRYAKKQCKRWILSTDGFYNAQKFQQRVIQNSFEHLLGKKCIYKDNATAIFFQS